MDSPCGSPTRIETGLRSSKAAVGDAGSAMGGDDGTSTGVDGATVAMSSDITAPHVPRPSEQGRDSVSGRSSQLPPVSAGGKRTSSVHLGGTTETPVSVDVESGGTNPLYKTVAHTSRAAPSTSKVCCQEGGRVPTLQCLPLARLARRDRRRPCRESVSAYKRQQPQFEGLFFFFLPSCGVFAACCVVGRATVGVTSVATSAVFCPSPFCSAAPFPSGSNRQLCACVFVCVRSCIVRSCVRARAIVRIRNPSPGLQFSSPAVKQYRIPPRKSFQGSSGRRQVRPPSPFEHFTQAARRCYTGERCKIRAVILERPKRSRGMRVAAL